MNRNRFFVFGCLGILALACGLIAVQLAQAEASGRIPLEGAKSHWADQGSAHYTLRVSHVCICNVMGVFRITVEDNRVTNVESLETGEMAKLHSKVLSDYDRLTIDNMLKLAEKEHHDIWSWPWRRWANITYDPTYGYVTSYMADDTGWGGLVFGGYNDYGALNPTYNASELVLLNP